MAVGLRESDTMRRRCTRQRGRIGVHQRVAAVCLVQSLRLETRKSEEVRGRGKNPQQPGFLKWLESGASVRSGDR